MIHGMVNVLCFYEFNLNHRIYVLNRDEECSEGSQEMAQGPARYEGKTWFIQLKDKRK